MLRKTVFWIHLACGVAAGLVILMMSVTGVVLTYERQLLDWADPRTSPADGAGRRPLAELIAAVQLQEPDFRASSVTIEADAGEPVLVGAGRGAARWVDPYTAEVLGDGASGLRAFFGTMTGWHRWFNAPRESRGPWRAITGASNLAFLFLLVSGLYLWLPRVMKWAAFRARLVFAPWSVTAKARDFNWHHVIGIWTAIPLIVIVATAAVFYYPWANELLYRSFGESPPARGGGAAESSVAAGNGEQLLSLDELLEAAAAQVERWNRIVLPASVEPGRPVRVSIDSGSGGQPQYRDAVLLDPHTGKVIEAQPFASQTPGQRARSWARFLHTGEAFGLIGQTVAGLVSLTSVLMVWTGLALAYRRLIAPLLRRRPASAVTERG